MHRHRYLRVSALLVLGGCGNLLGFQEGIADRARSDRNTARQPGTRAGRNHGGAGRTRTRPSPVNVVLALREQVGLTQEALARAGGTSQPAIAAYEASRLRQDPEAVLAQARRCLATMMARQQGLSQALREWGVLLERPVEALLPLLTDPDPWAREPRHQTPFGGVLTGAERAEAYRAFADDEARTA